MKRAYIIYILLCIHAIFGNEARAQYFPKTPQRETRAVWVTTFCGLDWPKAKATDERGRERQQREFVDMLDRLQRAGINTILLQTRVRGSVIYPSRLEPWDKCLTGKAGQSPGYDTLAFAVEECHKRGMQLHAWVVALQVAGNKYLDPAKPSTAQELKAICLEIVANYDVDGINFDYIRYPERPSDVKDKADYAKNTRGLGYNDWRRDNITRIVREVYTSVKSVKPWICVSSSPVGKYADTTLFRSGGWNARNAVFQDVGRWLDEGIHDAIFPMMYFRDHNFYPFALQWAEMAKDSGFAPSVVAPGLGIYFLSPNEKDWPLEVITRELAFMRQAEMGQCYFRAQFLLDNVKGLYDWLCRVHNSMPALPAALRCEKTISTDSIVDVRLDIFDLRHARLSVSTAAPRYNVYMVSGTDTIYLATRESANPYFFSPSDFIRLDGRIAVKPMSRYGEEGDFKVICIKSYDKSISMSEKSRNFAPGLKRLFY